MKRNKIIKKTLGTTIGGALFVGATTIGVSCACAKIEDEGQEIISASSEGDLKRGAKVNVKLYGKLK
jgi:hypothetical protein